MLYFSCMDFIAGKSCETGIFGAVSSFPHGFRAV
jgi:hypothetical protein